MDALKLIKETVTITQMADALGLKYQINRGTAKANCIFCDDEGGHLYLYQDSNRFHCFKCQRNGDAIDLAREGFKMPIESIKGLFGLDIPGKAQTLKIEPVLSPESKATPNEQEKPQNPADFADLYFDFVTSLTLSDRGRKYLTHRGITNKLIDRYDLKSIDDPQKELGRLLQRYSEMELLYSGIADYSKKGKLYLAFFMPAIVFPHFSQECKYISGISTRNLEGDTKSFKLHGISTPYFYGINANAAREIYVFEGIINALSYAVIAGRDNFLALSGLLTPAKYAELQESHPGQKLILGLDPDDAGKKALSQIENCTYIDWHAFALMQGYNKLQLHEDGKAWDINDYLTKGGNYGKKQTA